MRMPKATCITVANAVRGTVEHSGELLATGECK